MAGLAGQYSFARFFIVIFSFYLFYGNRHFFVITGDNKVVAKTSSHRLPVNGLYALKSSVIELPSASPAANSKAIVKTLQHIPISQHSLKVQSFIIRGYSNQVIRKIHTLNVIPLTGNAHSFPIALTKIYSRIPPLRIATGIKHNQIIKNFKMFMKTCIFR